MRERSSITTILISFALGAMVTVAATAAETRRNAEADLRSEIAGARVDRDASGRISAIRGLRWSPGADPELLDETLADVLGNLITPDVPNGSLRFADERTSLTGRHLRFLQFVDGVEVSGAGVSAHLDPEGRVVSVEARVFGPAPSTLTRRAKRVDAQKQAARAAAAVPGSHSLPERTRPILLPQGEGFLAATRVVVIDDSALPWIVDVATDTGEILSVVAAFFEIDGRLFVRNPIETTNDKSLQDRDDAADAVPDSSYSVATLPGLSSSGTLRGPFVEIIDNDLPTTVPAETSLPLLFDRSDDRFEEVNVYYQIDQSQRYLQSLGYSGAAQIIREPIRIDPHANSGADNSFFVNTGPGRGELRFGDGGVDDAEDPDIVLHEYGHAIQEAIAPGAYTGLPSSHPRALGEAFGDYWAFSSAYSGSMASGRDPFCVGDWDARCGDAPSTRCGYPSGANCLRRVDSGKTMADWIFDDRTGTEHKNGEIWSSALREIFVGIVVRDGAVNGRRIADRIILEGHFGAPPVPTFRSTALRMIDADRVLESGRNGELLCRAFVSRAILESSECELLPRGDVTVFQAMDRNVAIPDGDPAGISSSRTIADDRLIERLMVRVAIAHPYRGDLRLRLHAPDGRTVLLQEATASPGTDLHATFGLDTDPKESLDVFRGMPAMGTWTLHVIDTQSRDRGTLLSWSLLIRFQGDSALAIRPSPDESTRLVVPVVAKFSGYTSDLRVLNRGLRAVSFEAFFTPWGSNGKDTFGALTVHVESGELVILDDVVDWFRSSGLGNVEFRGGDGDLSVWSRTWSAGVREDATFGQSIGVVDANKAAGLSDPVIHVVPLATGDGRHSNFGFSEVSGDSGVVEVRFLRTDGQRIETRQLTISPYGIRQEPCPRNAGDLRAEFRVVSGGARIIVYGSTVDESSRDSVFFAGQQSWQEETRHVVPAAFRTESGHGVFWTTGLSLANTSDALREVEITLRKRGEVSPSVIVVPIPVGSLFRAPDLILTLFDESHAEGSLAVRVPDGVITTTTVHASRSTAEAAESMPLTEIIDAIGFGEPSAAAPVEISPAVRTNVGATEVDGSPALVRFRVFDPSGTERGNVTTPIAAHGQIHLNLESMGVSQIGSGYVLVDVVAGPGRVLAYSAEVDNISNDTFYTVAR